MRFLAWQGGPVWRMPLWRQEQFGVSLYWHAYSIETLLTMGNRNSAEAIMLALLAEMARAEKKTLVERTKGGLDAARLKGVNLGRPEGSILEAAELLRKHADIVCALTAGQSLSNAAKITGKGASTVQRVKSLLMA